MAGKSQIRQELLGEMTPVVRALVEALLVRQAELERHIEELKGQAAQREAKLGKNSGNSSQPPASEHPHAKPPPKKDQSKRKRGASRGIRSFSAN